MPIIFIRLCRDGQIQAQNFIETVPNKADALPPVIDLEYDSNCINTYTKEQLLKEIQVMHDRLYQHYGKQPIFYTSKAFYNIILAGEFITNTPLGTREYQRQTRFKKATKMAVLATYQFRAPSRALTKPSDLNVFNGDAEIMVPIFRMQWSLSDLNNVGKLFKK